MLERILECIRTQDWYSLRALSGPMLYEDRRRHIRMTGDVETFLASCRLIAERGADAQLAWTVLATAGERLVLDRRLWTQTFPDAGPAEIEALGVHEIDAEGRLVAAIYFDPADRRAASLELLERSARSAPPWFALSPDAMIEPLYSVAVERHGVLSVSHSFGTRADGGALESVFASLVRFEGGRSVGTELFELANLERARARFEELRPEPLPPAS